jgi:hypothetical protein
LAATAPILVVTSLMRYDTRVSRGSLWMDPVLPESYGGVHCAPRRRPVGYRQFLPAVQGLPEGMAFHRGHRPWMTELVEQASRHPKAQ